MQNIKTKYTDIIMKSVRFDEESQPTMKIIISIMLDW